MPDILSLIDNALDDNRLSGDAMRWTPDPPKVRAPITPEQARAALESLGRAFEPVVDGMKVMVDALGRAFADWWARVAPMLAAAQRLHHEVEAAKRVRLRRMHTSYHHRKR